MLIRYDGPRESVQVGGFGLHLRGKIEDYPEGVGRELVETSVRNSFVSMESVSTPANETKPVVEPKSTTAASPVVCASPAARKLAKELGLDLADITGTGHNGIITKADVEAITELPGTGD